MNNLLVGVKFFFVDLVADLVRWPIWWYSRGVLLVGGWGLDLVRGYAASIAVGVWIKNLFVPMFGARDWQSRIISFFMRLFQIFARGFMLFVFTIVALVVLGVYLLLPLVCVVGLVYQVFGDLM